MAVKHCAPCGAEISNRTRSGHCKDCRVRLNLTPKQSELMAKIKHGTYAAYYRRLMSLPAGRGTGGSRRRAHNQSISSLADRGLITFCRVDKTWRITSLGEWARIV